MPNNTPPNWREQFKQWWLSFGGPIDRPTIDDAADWLQAHVLTPARKVKLGEDASKLLEEVKSEELPASLEQRAKELYPEPEHTGEGNWELMAFVKRSESAAFIRGLKECMPLYRALEEIRDMRHDAKKVHLSALEMLFDISQIVAKALAAFPSPDKPNPSRVYDTTFGDERVCKCGHVYHRHFDWGNNYSVGCKYCMCYNFEELQPGETPVNYNDPGPDEIADKPAEDDGWIRVENGLPRSGDLVLCWRASSLNTGVYYSETGAYSFFQKGVWGNEEKDNWTVTHWQPLPSPPKTLNNE